MNYLLKNFIKIKQNYSRLKNINLDLLIHLEIIIALLIHYHIVFYNQKQILNHKHKKQYKNIRISCKIL